MKKYHFFPALLAAVLLLGAAAPAACASAPKNVREDAFSAAVSITAPELTCGAAILVDGDNDEVLFDHNAYERMYPASITKIMTSLLVMEAVSRGELSLDQEVTASETAIAAITADSSTQNIQPGEIMTLRDVLYCDLVSSANEACNILAETTCGTMESFVERMNQRAAELGMTDTTFKNATGLPAAGHVTSAHDIALMSRELIQHHPDIRQFTTIWMDSLRGGESQLVNTNRLVRFYDGATGLKTGFTASALYCLSGTAERDGMELIAVIMKDATSAQRFEDAQTLLSYGFAGYALKSVVPETPLVPVPVTLGTQATVQPVLGEGGKLLLEKTKAGALRQTVSITESVEAPVRVGDSLGTLTVTAGEEVVAEIPILAGEEIPRITYGQMLLRTLRMAFLSA